MSKMRESVAAAQKMGISTPTYWFPNDVAIAMLERKLATLKADKRRALCFVPGVVDKGTDDERVSLWAFTAASGTKEATFNGPEDDDGEDTSWVCPPNYLPGCSVCPPGC